MVMNWGPGQGGTPVVLQTGILWSR